MSKKEAKNVAKKEQQCATCSAVMTSSPILASHTRSSFYDTYKKRLDHILDQELAAENYKEKFHALLTLEEEEHAKQLKERLACACILFTWS